ncbi:MFS general substrate transporter [Corynespora cassiicola Philippines]|uniref:MFS general substrate transporter n=1 Tax=Corynespora cassiicola Philippines TaxID=1448308 RepID=A0A2T2N2L8_CORCC|nr:MFS general substrate transporter [Corynespora cassiicola Philippines]
MESNASAMPPWSWRKNGRPSNELRAKLAPHICVLIVLALNLAFYAKAAPTLRLVELTVCREYWEKNDATKVGLGGRVDEAECKVAAIQKKVAYLFMADELLHFCCDFIATVPLGILADRYGPKPVMLLNFVGLILSWVWMLLVCTCYNTFRPEAILLASLFCVPGGATHFNTAIIYSEAAIYTKNRTTTFSLLEFTIQLAQLAGAAIGPAFLLLGVYPPFYFVFPIALLSIPMALLLPSGGRSDRSRKRRASNTSSSEQAEESDRLLNKNAPPQNAGQSYFNQTLSGAKRELQRCWNLFTGWRVIQYGYAASLVVTLGKQALHVLLQYVSQRFRVSIAEAGFLFAIKAGVVIVLYLIILPALQRMVRGRQDEVTIKLARASIVLLTVGVALMGLAWNIGVLIPGLVLYSLGFGFSIAVRSLLSSLATKQDLPIPVIFSGIGIAETAGSFIGATALTGAFTRTLDLDGWIRGTPFFICSIFYLIILIPTWFANLQAELQYSRPEPVPPDEEDETIHT